MLDKIKALDGEEDPVLDSTRRVSRSDSVGGVGPQIEGYEIVSEISHGGQGVVYQAVQEATHRKVAIKVLLEGEFVSKSARRRFEREIELVASLRHPNIISIFHSGLTGSGQQFCVMDYVRGLPLMAYVREKKPTLEEALELFSTICNAVNYAHQKGVIHRDLKPSNILVDVEDVPRVLDFGLAKMVGGPEHTLVSVTGQVVGTLPYMSPEQARGNPDEIDIRTDVYALGVVLYEMLTGHYPYPVVGQVAEVLKHIAETQPTPPSRTWKSDSGVTKRSSKRLKAGQCPIDDEVQTIVLRALTKERERRYQSAGELSNDVSHYLAGEPIEAKRDSGWYVLKKQLRRYRVAVAVAAAFVLLLGVSTIALSVMYQNQSRARQEAELARDAEAEQRQIAEAAEREQSRAREEAELARTSEEEQRKLAEQRAAELETVTEFQASMLSGIEPEEMGRGIIADQRRGIAEGLAKEGVSAHEIETALASFDELVAEVNPTDLALGIVDENVLARAVETIEQEFANQPLVEAALRQTVADTYRDLGMYPQATSQQERALEIRRRVLGDDHPSTLTSINNMGFLLKSMGKFAEAEPYYREALEGRRRVLGDDHPDTLGSINNMGSLLDSMGKLTEAEPYYREALEGKRRVLGDDHPSTLLSINNMGGLLESMGKLTEAEPYYREALDGNRRVLGDDHPSTLSSINNMGMLLSSMGKLTEAEPYYREALEGKRRALGDDHPSTLLSINNMGGLLQSMGKLTEAETLGAEAVRGAKRSLPEGHWHTAAFLGAHGKSLTMLERYTEAETTLLEAHGILEVARGTKHKRTIGAVKALANLYDTWHEAEPDQGYDVKAAEWRGKLSGMDETTQSG